MKIDRVLEIGMNVNLTNFQRICMQEIFSSWPETMEKRSNTCIKTAVRNCSVLKRRTGLINNNVHQFQGDTSKHS